MKKVLSRILILCMIIALFAGLPPMQAAAPAILINQVYGTLDNTGAISHGFVELYNLSDVEVSLDSYSLQYAESEHIRWQVLPLSGTIQPRSSFLIRCLGFEGGEPRFFLEQFDMEWDEAISNRAYSIALVDGSLPLNAAIEDRLILDLVGAANDAKVDTAYTFEGAPFNGISKQKSLRRKDFTDTNNNKADFEALDYRSSGLTDAQLAEVKPRSSRDGAWGKDVLPNNKKLSFSHEAGLYDAGFSLKLSTGYKGGVIRYTTDGSDPSPESAEFSAAIQIRDKTAEPNVLSAITAIANTEYYPPTEPVYKGNAVKAQVFSRDGLPLTGVYTKSYFVNSKYKGLPIISIVTDASNFFDRDIGIYYRRNFNNSGADWERPAHLEFIEADGSVALSQNVGVRINGGSTRGQAQKALRFYASASRDAEHPLFDYDIFGGAAQDMDGKSITSFRRFIIRNAGQDWYNTLVSDSLSQRLAEGLSTVPYQAYRPAVAFLNGEFWGIYNIRERIDEYSLSDKYGIKDEKKIQIVEMGASGEGGDWEYSWEPSNDASAADRQLYDEMEAWFKGNADLSSAADYEKAQTFIDINNFIDYYILETYAANADWPSNNIEMWRYQTDEYPLLGAAASPTDGRWRFILKDMDTGFWDYNLVVQDGPLNPMYWSSRTDVKKPHYAAGLNYTYNSFAKLLNPKGHHDDKRNSVWATLLFRRLSTNAAFTREFVNRYCNLLNTNFAPDIVTPKIDEMVGAIREVIPQQIARWNRPFNWDEKVASLYTFAENRPQAIKEHLAATGEFGLQPGNPMKTITLKTDAEEGYLQINGMDILPSATGVSDPALWSGDYFEGLPQRITAVPYKGYTFVKFVVGDKSYVQNPLPLPLDDSLTVTAVFKKSDVKAEAWESPFADVADGDWFYNDVSYMVTNKLFIGTTEDTFSPKAPMTRGMLVTVLYRMQDAAEASYSNPFTDVPEGAYYTEAVKWAAGIGLVQGIGGGLFAPEAFVTRQDMAAVLTRAAAIDAASAGIFVTPEYRVFADEDAIAGYAKDALQTMNKLGIINGKGGGVIDPKGAATRAEFAAMLHRLLAIADRLK